MYPLRLPLGIRVLGADNYAPVSRLLPVQAYKVTTIDGEQCSSRCDRESQDIDIFDALIRLPCLEYR